VNPVPRRPLRIDPAQWDEPEMRAALAVRNATAIYRLLQKAGYSQQQIASLTGQSQPEVSSIIHGRKVMATTCSAVSATGSAHHAAT
jgi:predicted XRE-type DNA-binding protein